MNLRAAGIDPRGVVLILLLGVTMGGARCDTAGRAGPDWWSLQPVVRPAPPEVKQEGWIRNPIDRFILAALEARGLKPSPEATPAELSRRLSFGLIGLPPDPGSRTEVEALLASPHYGERWARHWLDVARFGESNGFEYDELRQNAWPYRDWLIEAFNADMPYDRFVRLQIAGDVLEPGNPAAITATSFLVCGSFDGLKPAGEKQRLIMRQDEMEDLVGTVSQSFLGLTVHCARCHDHKFDPIPQREYYQLASALAGVSRGERNVPAGEDVPALQSQLAALTRTLVEGDDALRTAILRDAPDETSPIPEPPAPISRWSFENDLRDEIGPLHGEARGGARLEGGSLVLDGQGGYVVTAPLANEIREKTLEAWVRLENLSQRGGAVLSLQGTDGGQFDAIVYGEREPGRWMAGSDGFSRTQSFGVAEEEREATREFVHVALVYEEDGTITGYRNGVAYGSAYKTGGATFSAGSSEVLFGLRHGTGAGKGRMLAGRIDRAQLYDRALTGEEIARSANVRIVSEAQLLAHMTPARRDERKRLRAESAELAGRIQMAESRKVFAVTPSGSPVTRVLGRGSPFEPGEEVSAGGVAALRSGASPAFNLAPDAPEDERRKKLAEWITHPDNPLLARVMMNRLWHYHFGQGLVKTPSDLGFSGGLPSHPELLDWLAAEFRAQGWSLKAMHRLVVDSATYRQSSRPDSSAQQVDAGNVYLWRRTPMRLEAEEVRDAILAVAGQLNPQRGGPGFRDFNMYKHKGSWVYDPIDPEGAEFNRRSIYRTWARGSVHPLLAPLDCPDPSAAAPVRSVTTTPLGALALMNTSFVLRMADHFAERLRQEAGEDPAAQASRGIALAFGRPARPDEVELTTEFIRANGLAAFGRVLFNANEFLYVN